MPTKTPSECTHLNEFIFGEALADSASFRNRAAHHNRHGVRNVGQERVPEVRSATENGAVLQDEVSRNMFDVERALHRSAAVNLLHKIELLLDVLELRDDVSTD